MTPQHIHIIPTSCAILPTMHDKKLFTHSLNKDGTQHCSLHSLPHKDNPHLPFISNKILQHNLNSQHTMKALSVCLVTDIISSENGGLDFVILRHDCHINDSCCLKALSVCLVTDIISSENGGLDFVILHHHCHINGSKRQLRLPRQLWGNLVHPLTPAYFVHSHHAFKSGEVHFDMINFCYFHFSVR